MGVTVLFLSLTYLVLSFFYSGNSKRARRQRSWIITTTSSACMTALASPLVVDLTMARFDWQYVDARIDTLSTPVCMLFAGYLVADLLVGSIAYRDQIQFSSGWVHHSVYIILCLFWAHMRWSHGFAVAAFMELPTFVMGIGALVPSLRTHWGFTISFLLTRIGFHIGVIYSLTNPKGHFLSSDATARWGPMSCALLALPMHIFWGYKCVRGLVRHRRRVAEARIAAASSSSIIGLMPESEHQVRARKLLDGAVRRLWHTAPEAWRKAYTDELIRCREEGVKGKWAPRSLVASRALGRRLSEVFKSGKDNVPGHREDVQSVSHGTGIEVKIPPELQLLRGQKFVVSEFPVEREALRSRRKRIVGAMRRKLEVARRDMVVF